MSATISLTIPMRDRFAVARLLGEEAAWRDEPPACPFTETSLAAAWQAGYDASTAYLSRLQEGVS